MNTSDLSRILASLPPADRIAFANLMKERGREAAIERFDLKDALFDKQVEVIEHPSRRKVVVASRRSGKSYMIMAYMLDVGLKFPNSRVVYVGLSIKSAKGILEEAMSVLSQTYKLPCEYKQHIGEIHFANGSKIMLAGCQDRAQIELLRGFKFRLAVADEIQSAPLGEYLIDEILKPALRDLSGTLVVSGTPDPLGTSALFKAWHGEKPFMDFQKFSWNTINNPKFPAFVNGDMSPETYLDVIKAETGYTDTSPAFIREYLGKFCNSVDDLAYGFDPDKHSVSEIPSGHEWMYVLGIDCGYRDSDAIVCIAFSYTCKTAYIVESYTKAEQDITAFMEAIGLFYEKYNHPKTVMDYGGGGLKIIAEIRSRYKIPAVGAEKYNPKISGAQLVAADFRTERLKVVDNPSNTALMTQLATIITEQKKSRNGVMVTRVRDGGDDLCDAMLYAFKFVRHYFATERINLTPDERVKMIIEDHKKQLEMEYREDIWQQAVENKSWV